MTSIQRRCLLILPLILVAVFGSTGCASHHRSHVVYIETGPPEPVVEVVTLSPGAGYVWVPGHHRWDGRHYVWIAGRWQLAPRGRRLWVAGRWESSARGWYWVDGHWN